MPIHFAPGPGREKAERLAIFYLLEGFADAFYGLGAAGWVVRGDGVNGYEVGAHAGDVIEYHVDHDAEFWAARTNQVNQSNSVEGTEWVVTHGDEGAFGKMVEQLGIVNTQCVVKFLKQQTLGAFWTGLRTGVGVSTVNFIYGEEFKKCVNQTRMAVKAWHHATDIVIVQHVGAHFLI